MSVHWGGRGSAHGSRTTFPGVFVGGGEPTLSVSAPVLSNLATGWTAGDNPPHWDATYDGWTPYDSGTGTGNRVRAVWTFRGGAPVTEAWQGLTLANTMDTLTWPLLAAADLSLGGSFSVYEEMDYVVSSVEQAISAHSNTWSDTLGTTVTAETAALWNSTTGVNKSQYIAVSGSPALVATGQAGFANAPISVRATQHRTGKRQFQITLGGTVTSPVHIGIDDGTDNFQDAGTTNFSRPGKDNSSGVDLRMDNSPGNTSIAVGGANVQTALSPEAASGDIITVEFDTAGGTLSFYRTRSGTTIQIGTTLTGLSFTNWYANCGAENATAFTALFGTGQTRTLGTGYVNYDN